MIYFPFFICLYEILQSYHCIKKIVVSRCPKSSRTQNNTPSIPAYTYMSKEQKIEQGIKALQIRKVMSPFY